MCACVGRGLATMSLSCAVCRCWPGDSWGSALCLFIALLLERRSQDPLHRRQLLAYSDCGTVAVRFGVSLSLSGHRWLPCGISEFSQMGVYPPEGSVCLVGISPHRCSETSTPWSEVLEDPSAQPWSSPQLPSASQTLGVQSHTATLPTCPPTCLPCLFIGSFLMLASEYHTCSGRAVSSASGQLEGRQEGA